MEDSATIFFYYAIFMNFLLCPFVICVYRVIDIMKFFEIENAKQIRELFFCDDYEVRKVSMVNNLKAKKSLNNFNNNFITLVIISIFMGFLIFPISVISFMIFYIVKYLFIMLVSACFYLLKGQKKWKT